MSTINEFWKSKYIKESNKSWNNFYKRNSTKFFKDRHWTLREFPELDRQEPFTLLEVGCGVGNFAIPLLECNEKLTVYSCDVSETAIELIKTSESYINLSDRFHPCVADVTDPNFIEMFPPNVQFDVISLIFILSALPADKHSKALDNLFKLAHEETIIVFRDYAENDAAQLRFKNDRKIDENLFVRQDGTLSYFFSLEYLKHLFETAGFETIECQIVNRDTINRKEGLHADRLFIQGKFVKRKA